MFVAPDARRRGVGTGLFEHVVDHPLTKQRAIWNVFARTSDDARDAHAFLLHLGFREVVRLVKVLAKFQRWNDWLTYNRTIAPQPDITSLDHSLPVSALV